MGISRDGSGRSLTVTGSGDTGEVSPDAVEAAWREPAFASFTGSSEDVDLGLDADPTLPDLPLPPPKPAPALARSTDQVPLAWALRRMRVQTLLSGLLSGTVVALAFLAWQSFVVRAPPAAGATTATAEALPPAVSPVTTPPTAASRRSAAPGAASGRAAGSPEGGQAGGWIQVEDAGEEATAPGGEAAEAGDDASGDEASARADAPEGDAPADEASGEAAAAAEPGTEHAAPTPGPHAGEPEPAAATRAPDAVEVAAALRVRRTELEACIAEANAAGEGDAERNRRLRLLVVIEPSGRVSNAFVNDEPGDSSALGACLLRIAQAMSFKPFEGDSARVRLALSRPAR